MPGNRTARCCCSIKQLGIRTQDKKAALRAQVLPIGPRSLRVGHEAGPLDDTASRGSADDGTKPLAGKATREPVNDEAVPFATRACGWANDGVVPRRIVEEVLIGGG